MTLALQGCQRGGEAVQLRHPVGTRALKSDDDHDVAGELATLKAFQHGLLTVEDSRGRFDDAVVGADGRYLDHRAAEISAQELEAAVGAEGIGCGPQYRGIA